MDITLNGSSVSSVQKPFGNEPLMAEIEESSEKLLGCVLFARFFFFLPFMNFHGTTKITKYIQLEG